MKALTEHARSEMPCDTCAGAASACSAHGLAATAGGSVQNSGKVMASDKQCCDAVPIEQHQRLHMTERTSKVPF